MNKPNHLISRRRFFTRCGKMSAGLAAYSMLSQKQIFAHRNQNKIVVVGTGRHGLNRWCKDLIRQSTDKLQLVGLCDCNSRRLEVARAQLERDIPIYSDFDRMVQITKPNWVIVSTVNSAQAEYISRGLGAGCHVIAERPMATDEKECQAILAAEKQNNRQVVVAADFRISPYHLKIKEILASGEIGEIVSADLHYYMNPVYSAEYFRHWHRFRAKSGTLLVHLSSHHFDLMNWWLAAEPLEVFAYGQLNYFGAQGPFRNRRCLACTQKQRCPHYWDITKNDDFMKLYVDCETNDGYFRDACVFGSEIDIWDTMAVQVKYNNGTHLSYSLNLQMPYNGHRITINGLKGRLEAGIYERQSGQSPATDEIRLIKNSGTSEIISIPHQKENPDRDSGIRNLFLNPAQPGILPQTTGSHAGILAVITSIAARKSIDQKEPVQIRALLST